MSINKLQKRYKELIHKLHDVEKTIIYLRGEMKWQPSAPARLFEEHDGAVINRAHLEEELYELGLKIKHQRHLDEISGEENKVIPFPIRLQRKSA
ncbi:hypothetical protein ACFLRA_02640 [Bdellovibrionota bacterium]